MDNNINIKNNINFGNLYVKKGLFRFNKTYKYNNDIFNITNENIKALANDVDIIIRYRNFGKKGFDIKVGEVIDSPIKRFFKNDYIKETIRPEDLYFKNIKTAEFLINKVKETKDYFMSFKDYLTKS